MLAVLRRRNFVMVWLAGVISDTGDWLLITGLPIYVYFLTGSTLVTSSVFIVEMVPLVLFSSFAGVMVDRWDRQRTMSFIPLAQAVLLLPLLLVHSSNEVWMVYPIAAGQAVLAQFFEPAKNAALPALVEREDLGTANGLVGISSNAGRLVGSSLGGLALVGGTLNTIVVADVVTFLVAATLIRTARFGSAKAEGGEPRPAPVIQAWREGISLIAGRRAIRGAFLSMALASLAQGIFVVLFLVFVARALHGNAAEIGLLRGIQAIGGLAGGILVGVTGKRLGADRAIAIGAFGTGLLEFAIWNGQYATTAEALYVGLFIAIGIPGMFHTAGTFTLLQQQVPEDFIGRIIGALLSVYGGFQALGMLIAGLLGEWFDVTVILEFQAGLYVLAAIVAHFEIRIPRQETRSEPDSEPESDPESDPESVTGLASEGRDSHGLDNHRLDSDSGTGFDALSAEEAESELLACCASKTWARSVAAVRPYADRRDLLATATATIKALSWDNVLEALDAHPRIGDRVVGSGREAAWSRQEQSGIAGADDDIRSALTMGNVDYERRFGHVFLICANGRSTDEMLDALHRRLGNTPEAEQDVVRDELAAITLLRLDRLLDQLEAPASATARP
jgi:OHCU decarboxylase